MTESSDLNARDGATPDTQALAAVWVQALDQAFATGSVDSQQRAFINLTKPLVLIDDTLLIAVPNEFTRLVLESRYQPAVSAGLATAFGRPIRMAFSIDPNIAALDDDHADEVADEVYTSPAEPEIDTLSPEARDDASRLNPKYTFDTFVKGATNRFAAAAAQSVAERPGQSYNPLFIWGESGLGKTHLLHAIGNYTRSLYRGKRVRYVSSEEFTNEFINCIRDDKAAQFQKKYRDIDVLLVDDIQFLSGKVQTQEEFFHTFNTLHNANKQIVITSDLPPKQLQDFEDRMRSRFVSGFLIDIQPPDLETRIAILRKKTLQERLSVPSDVLEYIASKISTNIRELEGALIRVTAWANLNKQTPDRAMAEMVLRDLIADQVGPEITVNTIMEVTATFFGVTMDDLCGNSREKDFVSARQMAMYLCRELTDLSLPKIGQAFGNRDHTTVMHADRKIRTLMAEQRVVFNQVAELTQRIRSHSR
uniref:Chromosomal replication initiator protein DnaA n=1 Tax=uncultured Actinomycetes bacterium TaxID=152507 RepID=A0A871YED5_9ACTN|nr:Chromosomal replication initiator protein DnaA [uncultured Actinomycetes bacterium]